MKPLIIIDTYPNTALKYEVLKKCILAYADVGFDMMVVSHYPLPEEISHLVQFVIYDSDNTMLPAQYTPFWWMETQEFKASVFNKGHSLPICRNVKTGISMAKAVGYEHFIFSESDIHLSTADCVKLVLLVAEMIKNDNKMIFFRPEEYRDCGGSYVYETLFFGGNVSYFLDTFQPPINVTEWLSSPMGYTLELSFYEKFSKDEHLFLIIKDHSSAYFSDSDVNICRYGLVVAEVLYNEKEPDVPILFLSSFSSPCDFTIYKNDNKNTVSITNGGYYFDKAAIGDVFVVEWEEEERHFTITPDTLKYKEKGTFIFL